MSELHELRLYDRSRVTTDWRCPRMRYLQYEYDGKGIVSGNTSLELFIGTTLHDGLAAIANGVDIESIAAASQKQILNSLLEQTNGEVDEVDFASEQAALVEGLLRGFYKHVWPRLRAQFPEIVKIEPELLYPHDGLGFMAKPDLVVRDNEGNLWYLEYKSTSSKKEAWVNSWATAVQLHSSIKAIEVELGEPVTGVIVQGMYKGFESYRKQSSPFCYAYRRNGNPPFSETETLYEYKAGFKRVPTWTMDGGVKAWVEGMPETVLADQFPQVPPIFIKETLIQDFFYQRSVREHEIELANQLLEYHKDDPESVKNILNAAYLQRFDQCIPSFGKQCAYLRICHGNVQDPLNEGFEYRVPHHALELEQWQTKITGPEDALSTPGPNTGESEVTLS